MEAKQDQDLVLAEEAWLEGKAAPYDLYDGHGCVPGTNVPPLVEARGDGHGLVIRAGEPISQALAERVRAQLQPDPLPAVEVPVPVLDEAGRATFDDNGLVTRMELVAPSAEVFPLSPVQPVVHAADDMHCDMCGRPQNALKRIGIGWYCESPRLINQDTQETATCFDLRLRQMGVQP